jgi:hypothetical protein
VILLHLYSTELEITLSPTFLHSNDLTSQQRRSLNAGVESIKCWFDVFFNITPAAYIGFPFSIFSQLFRCLLALYRLTTVDDVSWDVEGVLTAADALLILDHVINNMEQVATVAGLDQNEKPGEDVFHRGVQMFRSLRAGWEAKLDPAQVSTFPTPQDANENFPLDSFAVEFFDNEWLMDLLVSPSHQPISNQ